MWGVGGALVGGLLGWLPAGIASTVIFVALAIVWHDFSSYTVDVFFKCLWILIGLVATGGGFLTGYGDEK
jgi:hypothetical protein